MPESILVERKGTSTVLLTLNRPETLNSVDLATGRLMSRILTELGDDASVNAIVLTGAGERAFSSGYDIHELAKMDANEMLVAFALRDPLLWQLTSHPKPIIAAMRGVAYGVGALFGAAADLRIGGPSTTFKVTATKYGSANATWSLPPLIGMPKTKELLMTGRAMGAEEMLEVGLLNKMVPDERIVDAALELAGAIAANPPLGVQCIKRLVNGMVGRTLEDGFRHENSAMTGELPHRGGGEIFGSFIAKSRHPA
jgi:enoyl-CoA hydratase/carnithine racemase